MIQDAEFSQRLKDAGASDDLIAQYQRYTDSGNRHGQERILCRYRRVKNDKLTEDREKLACLDYIITKIENTYDLFENN